MDVTRIKVCWFQAIEDKVNDLLEAHEKKVRTKWLYLQEKPIQFAEATEINDFKAPQGWL